MLRYQVIELDEQPQQDGPMIQHELFEMTAQRTVPNVFIRGIHIGGNSDVQKLAQSTELHDLIRGGDADLF